MMRPSSTVVLQDMPEHHLTFQSEGLTIKGAIRVPAGVGASERRSAFIVLHGFGSTMHAGNVLAPCAMFEELGYVTMRFDMPGCGESEGERGLLLCPEQVKATSAALSVLAQNPRVDAERIAVF